jgi:hypothetical protein
VDSEGHAAKLAPSHRFGFSDVDKIVNAPVISSQAVQSKIAEFAELKIDWGN